MRAIPRSIQASIIGFLLAFLSEAFVEVALVLSQSLTWTGWLAVTTSLFFNLLALTYGIKRRRWAFDLLKWIAGFSLAWTVVGGPYLHALGLWAIALIALCVWLRVGAMFMLRRKAARDWIDTSTNGACL